MYFTCNIKYTEFCEVLPPMRRRDYMMHFKSGGTVCDMKRNTMVTGYVVTQTHPQEARLTVECSLSRL